MARIPTQDDEVRRLVRREFDGERITCAACGQTATPEAVYGDTFRSASNAALYLGAADKYPWYTAAVAICSGCGVANVFMSEWNNSPATESGDSQEVVAWQRRVHPVGRAAKPFASVPAVHLNAYRQACATIDISPAASACMSRRCLQGILQDQGHQQRSLYDQIQSLLREQDPRKVLPEDLRSVVDSVREYGNFGAHPINDQTTLQIIEVEPNEAEWCIEIAEQLMGHYYERPARMKAMLDAKDKKLAPAKGTKA